ncbi:MAG TPA: kelch repeat-containing protein [Pyrinomonadaceae bacterium]|nr:kelch repeat-containing protein [Pyrinomonadaceae bacterium]
MRMFSSTRPTATSSNSKRSLFRKSRTRLIAITSLTAMAAMIFASTSFATRSLTQSWFENVASLIKGGTTSSSSPAHANESMSLESPLSPLPAMATERRGHTATRLADGRVLIAGGESGSGALNETEIYDPTSATFSVSGNMSTARVDHSATLLADGRVLIAGGRNGAGSIPTTEMFDPSTGTFSSGPVMSVARAGHSATLFADGRILIVGGDATGSAEVFDAAANTFTALDSHLTDPRSMHSAALLLDGRVVVVGGRNSGGEDLKSVEIFDTPASTFSTVDNSLTVARSRALLRVLFDGKVQIIGGNNDGSMEIYDPMSESIGAYAHVLPETDTCTGLKPGVMASQTRAALFHNGQTDALLDRSGHTITEINGQALIVGGANSSGAILSSTEVLTSYSASITTDKLDYAPGETATFTGRGFLAGETVRIAIHEDPHTPQERSIQVVADADGNISGGYLVQEYDLRLQFIASAKGQTSGITAQTTFTDDTNITTATVGTRESTCTTNTTSFTQGQTICGNAVITGVGGGGGAGSFFIVWFNPSNVAVKTTTNTVPATTPTTFNDTLTTNGTSPTGTWSVHVCKNATCSGGNDVASASFTLAAPATNSVTFDATPIGDVPAGTTVLSVTIGAGSPTAVTRGELPKTFTGIASGTNVAYSYVSPITQSATKQYRWLSTTGPVTTQSGNFTLSSNTNVSATYQAQFLQTFTHSGLTADATGTVVTVDTAAKTFTDLAFTKFVDSGATVTYSYNDPVTSSVTGKQYRRSSVTGPASGYTVAGANTITGNYVAQFLQTFQQTGLTADASGTVATVDAVAKTFADLAFSKYVDSGSTVSYSFTNPVTSSVTGKQYRLDSTTGPATGYTVSAANTITGNYVAQYKLTLAVTAGVPGGTTNITGGTNNTFYDDGTVLNLTATTPVADGPGKQWRFDNWTGDVPSPPNANNPVSVTMSAARSVTANYVAQYQLTLAVTAGVPGGTTNITGGTSGTFYDSGTVLNLTATSPVADGPGKQWRFDNWTGDVPTPPNTSNPVAVTMNVARSITANYVAQYQLTLAVTAGVPGGLGNITGGTSGNFYDSGTVLNLTAASPVADGPTKQWRFDNWTGDVTSPPNTSNPVSVTMNQARSITANYVAQYLQTFTHSGLLADATGTVVSVDSVNKSFGDLPFTKFVDTGATVSYTFSNPVTSSVSGKQYRLASVTGAATGYTVSGANTITGNYAAQYQLTLAITVGVPGGLSNITGGTSGNFYDDGTALNLTAATPVADGADKQWRFDNWTGDVPTPPNTSNPVGVTMNQARSVTANYVAQYRQTFTATGLGGDATGTVVTVDASAKTSGDLPFSKFVDAGATVSYSFTDPVTSSVSGKQYRLNGVTGPATGFTVSAANTITGAYVAQFLQTFTSSGLAADATGTVVTVDGDAKTLAMLPFNKYVDDGATVTYAFNNPVSSSITGKRYRLDSVSGPTTGYTVSGASTVTGNYVIQYQLSLFITAGVPAGLANITGGSDGTFYDSGANLNLSAATPVTETATKRWRFDNWTGDVTTPPNTSNPVAVTMNQPRSITANYVAQYLQTFNHSGLASDATNTVVTVDGDAQEFGDLPFSKFVDQGATVSYTFTNPVTSNVTDKQYRLDSVTGPASGYSVSAANTVVGNYVAQFAQHFKQTGLTSDATLTVVTVDGSDKTYADLEFTKYVDAGVTVTYSYNDPVASTITGKRYRRTSVTGPASGYTVSGANTITGNYVAQYQLTLAITAGVPGGLSNISGGTNGTYYDDGTNLNLTAATPVAETATKRWRFTNWTGDVSGSPNSANPVAVTMDQARSITANYVIQWLLTFAQTGIGSDTVANTVVTVSGNAKAKGVLPYTEWFDDGSNISYSYETNVDTSPASTKRYRRDSVSGIASGAAVTAASTITGNYVTQWQLTFAQSGIGGDTGTNTVATVGASAKQATDLPYTDWFDDGATVNYSYEAFVNSSSSTKRYKRTSVSGIPTGTSVTAASTITGNYVVQWQLTFTATGLPIGGSSATGANTVVTVGGNAKTAPNLPFSDWYDNGTSLAYVYSTPVSTDPVSSTQYELTNGGSLPSSPINVTSAQTITGNYSVNNYTIHYLMPIDESTLSTYRLNTGKNGRVIPVKVQIYKNGVPVEAGTVLMRVMGSNCTADDGNSLVEEYADAGNANGNTNLFRWNAGTPGFWIYNLDTKALGLATNNCYRLDVYLNSYTGPTAIKLSTSIFALFKPVK